MFASHKRDGWLGRRRFLGDAAAGMESIALAWLLNASGAAGDSGTPPSSDAKPATHFAPKARRAIHIFSPGGVSHVDSFDYKPELEKLDGKALSDKGTLDTFFGRPGNLLKSLYEFKRRGESGLWVSELFPHLANCADQMTFLYSVVSKSSSHTPACFQMNTGFTQNGYPCLGSWLSYGLGSDNDQLPTFVVLPDPRGDPNGGTNNWSNGFLPAEHQGTAFKTAGNEPIANLNTPAGVSRERRRDSLELLSKLNRQFAAENPGDSALAARVRSYELAAKMQLSIPEAVDFDGESAETKRLYGIDEPATAAAGKNFLLARRLLERGVRFVQVYSGASLGGNPRINWDAHEDVKTNHDAQAPLLDKPCAGLLKDLMQRGMLDDTLVFWSSEFGRTPFTEGVGTRGRDHHNLCFTVWMAGAGLKKGFGYGRSDEVGYQPAENPVTVYDVHATILHLLGIDHTRLTYYHNGIQRRLTDVHGKVIDGILA
ncbi:MAG TPA: DUF1501 domain-containing protein [Planctomycetaceae bacterium]|nr:DUF1501 domain-containing protein [Planctomycetaceae bacterium]